MSRPLWSVRYVPNEALLPSKLEKGRAYFIADEQCIVVDMGDGRGPVRYGDKPGPQGQPGEPIPSLQGQIDELAAASMQTTLNIHNINTQTRQDYKHLQEVITSELQSLRSQSDENANSVMKLLLIVHDKFIEYDNALNILAKTIGKLYPENWGGPWKPDSPENYVDASLVQGEIITSDGTSYSVEDAYMDGDTGVVVLTLYETDNAQTIELIKKLKAGDTVKTETGIFTVDKVSSENGTGIISITLYDENATP